MLLLFIGAILFLLFFVRSVESRWKHIRQLNRSKTKQTYTNRLLIRLFLVQIIDFIYFGYLKVKVKHEPELFYFHLTIFWDFKNKNLIIIYSIFYYKKYFLSDIYISACLGGGYVQNIEQILTVFLLL